MEARSLETIVETFSYQRKMETLVTVLPDLGHYCRSATEIQKQGRGEGEAEQQGKLEQRMPT